MFGYNMEVTFWEWVATRSYAQEYIAAYGFVNNVEVPEEIYEINWEEMEASLDEGVSDLPQTEEDDVIDSYITIDIEGVEYNSKTKFNRVDMIEALVDWSQIEDEAYDVHYFFQPTESENQKDEI